MKILTVVLLVSFAVSSFAQSVRENVVQKVALPTVHRPAPVKAPARPIKPPRTEVPKPVDAALKK